MTNLLRIALNPKTWICLLLTASWIFLAPKAEPDWAIAYAIIIILFIGAMFFWEKPTK